MSLAFRSFFTLINVKDTDFKRKYEELELADYVEKDVDKAINALHDGFMTHE